MGDDYGTAYAVANAQGLTLTEIDDREYIGGTDGSTAAYFAQKPTAALQTGIGVSVTNTASAVGVSFVMAAQPEPVDVADVIPPTVNLTSPSTFKMSDESTKDAYNYTFSANEAGQAWKIKVVDNAADVHTAGTQVESGGSFTSGQVISGSITYAELVAAGMGAEGVKILKFFAQDTAGNWST
jgi:hypothetical protein